jgi:hypothetical protein
MGEPGDGVSKAQAFDRLWRFLAAQHSAFYAYILAFYLIWIIWRQHHKLLDQVSHVSTSMISFHFPLLLLAALLPYTATVMGHYPDNPRADRETPFTRRRSPRPMRPASWAPDNTSPPFISRRSLQTTSTTR